jgi:aldehyde dehydrogenase (NAD+)
LVYISPVRYLSFSNNLINIRNATALYLGWKIAPALAAGNTFIFKTSEKAPFTPLAIAQLYKEAGFPPGVVNFISGSGSTGALLAAHMDIDKISFTGSGTTGRKVQDAAAKSNLKKVTLELGGKSPALIFDDANLENAIAQ